LISTALDQYSTTHLHGRLACADRARLMEVSIMETSTKSFISLYEQRIRLVAHALTQNSKLSEKDAADLAVHVLYAIDHIPEKVR
jgi:uncharacterized protein DUF6307